MTTATVIDTLRLAVIIGSVRENRFADTVAGWFVAQADEHDAFEVDVIDVAAAGEFASRLDAADAFVVITPEYNHGYPGQLKAAIDSAYWEWHAKPVGFVSYGGISGGLRAVEQLRQVFGELHTVTVRDGVSLHWAYSLFSETGQLHEPDGPGLAAKTMLDQLLWWARALRRARDDSPYQQ